MKRTYRKSSLIGKAQESLKSRNRRTNRKRAKIEKPLLSEAIQVGVQLPLGADALQAALSSELSTFATSMGLLVAKNLLEDEVRRLCGDRYTHSQERTHSRYGHQSGFICLAGQKLSLKRPRVRSISGGEAQLPIYGQLQSPEAMPQAALTRLVRGISTRDYEEVVDLAREGFGVAKSSVSRAFVQATAEGLKQFSERKFDQERFLAIYVDGVEYAGETLIAALGVTDQGEKRILGLRQGGTENSAVCIALFEDLQARGLRADQPVLFVLDGSKALHTAVKRVWGEKALIQRCQIHKRRNVLAHLPEKHHAECVRQLTLAYQAISYEAALKQLKLTASWLDRLNPDAAASLREGMEETLTVVKLGLASSLQRTLVTTNPIESAFSIARRVTARVTRWRAGNMRLRWCYAGLMRAEQKFRRIKGYKQLNQLQIALDAKTQTTLASKKRSA